MDGIEIINFARKPVNEVWFLRVTTVSDNFIPITKTAYRRITTPKDQLTDDLLSMIRGRLTNFMGLDPDHTLEEAGYKFYLLNPDGSHQDLTTRKGDKLFAPFRSFLDDEHESGGSISCLITNALNSVVFEIIPSWLPKDQQPPNTYALNGSSKARSRVTLFVKCVRVKVK